MERVVVTGAGAICSLGSTGPDVLASLRDGRSAVRPMPEWQKYKGLRATLGAPVTGFETPGHYTRRQIRSMGRVAMMAVRASELALSGAGLLDDPILQSGDVGVAFGSSMGSTEAVNELAHLLVNHSTDRLNATTYVRMMSHTAPVNIDVFFGLVGRVHPTCSACTSGSQSIGYACETLRDGRQTAMIAGGADELFPLAPSMFGATASGLAHCPPAAPRPFDRDADGPVAGEGACALILENYEHARARGAPVLCELVGFATNSGVNLLRPDKENLARCIRLALADAGLAPEDIGYVAACGLASPAADVAESRALHSVFGDRVPVSALKSFLGHTLAASGALEAWIAVEMMKTGWFAPTLHLDEVHPRCADLDYVTGSGRESETEFILCNTLAFGGINTSLIFRRV